MIVGFCLLQNYLAITGVCAWVGLAVALVTSAGI